MKTLLLVVALVGCKASGTDNLPIGTGGGGGGGGGGAPDSAIDGNGSGSNGMIAGRACLLTDPRDLVTCATTGAAGLSVQLGSQTATTADDGSFSIAKPTGSGLVWVVGGSNFETSLRPYTQGDAQIPVMTATMFVDVEADTGTGGLAANQGAVFVRVASGSSPLAGATVSSNPQAFYNTYYDGTTVAGWQTLATGTHGTAYVAGIATGTATISVTPSGGSAILLTGIPVGDATATFLSVTAP